MTEEYNQNFRRWGFGPDAQELLQRFWSILLTALISAGIAFLQSLLVEPALIPNPEEHIKEAGAIGAVLRTAIVYWQSSAIMRG